MAEVTLLEIKGLKLSVPQFAHLENGDDGTYLLGILVRINVCTTS